MISIQISSYLKFLLKQRLSTYPSSHVVLINTCRHYKKVTLLVLIIDHWIMMIIIIIIIITTRTNKKKKRRGGGEEEEGDDYGGKRRANNCNKLVFFNKHRNSSVKQCILIQFIHLVNGFYLLFNTHLSLFIETSFKLYNWSNLLSCTNEKNVFGSSKEKNKICSNSRTSLFYMYSVPDGEHRLSAR